MAKFPSSEAEIARLAASMLQAFTEHPEEYPGLPVAPEELKALLDDFNAHDAKSRDLDGRARDEHATKDKVQERLVKATKANLRHVEILLRDQPERLTRIGWGPRREAAPMEVPGDVHGIRVMAEGDTWIVLGWKAPVDGGTVQAYKVQRRKRDVGAWEDVATSVELELLVSNQPRAIEFEYRVVGVNKAGTGQPSATVTVVL